EQRAPKLPTDGPWLNESGSPRAAGSPCAAAGPFSVGAAALLAALMGLLVLATVLGNALVVLAFAVERSLRTQGNFFFLNLALADLLVGGFCIPLYIPYVLTGEWRLGRGLCKLWLVVDYLVCTASVFNIVLISFDRFVSVTRAVNYRAQKGMTRSAILKMVTVWIAAFLLYGPAILSWEHIAQKSILPEGECHAEFFYNWYFLMIASTIEFFTPFVTVTYFNVSIYLNIRKRTSFRSENLPPGQDDCEVNFQGKKREHNIFFVKSSVKMILHHKWQKLTKNTHHTLLGCLFCFLLSCLCHKRFTQLDLDCCLDSPHTRGDHFNTNSKNFVLSLTSIFCGLRCSPLLARGVIAIEPQPSPQPKCMFT
uniref:Histamine H3 receptor-like n=1 Tax=Nothoprocta perdicaria TaxID=30464 RepID=A0A8C6ZTX5_NOTPE